nr:outer membrane beta-barrel protein [Legionella jordanis]
MNKYFSLLMGLGLLPLNANASWYGVINLGGNAVDVEKQLIYPLEDPFASTANFDSGYSNFHGQLAAGYEFLFAEQYGFSIEGNADLFTGKAKHNIDNWFFSEFAQAEEQLKYGFSLFALPEYRYNTAVRLFAGPGVSTSKFEVGYDNTAGNLGVSGNFDKWLTGWSVKAGIANQITDYAELMFTYQFTQYESVTWTTVEPLSGSLLRGRYRPDANLFMVGIRFHLPEGQPYLEK